MASRASRSLTRRPSVSHYASSASPSPERRQDDLDDDASFMLNANESVSSLAGSEADHMSDPLTLEIEERYHKSPISKLPAELMIAIFQKLPKTEDFLSCMLVSREWSRNSVGLLWHRPTTANWQSLHVVAQTLRSTSTTFDYHQLVKRLNLSGLGSQVSDGTLLPFETCKRIERLTLTNCSKLSDEGISRILEDSRSLAALDVTGIQNVTDQAMHVVAQNCYRLQGLNITNCRNISDQALEAVAEACRHLKRLKFNGCQQLTNRSIIAVARHCHQLLEIDLAECIRMDDVAVTALIIECFNLRELRLAKCARITDNAFTSLQYGITYDSLRILDLTDCSEIQDAGISRIIEAAPRLRNLVLAKCRQITDRAILAITKLGKNLHYIHLGHCARITDAGVTQLVRICNRIRYIDLACCTNLTDESIKEMANLPKLKRIGLVKCGNITDASIYALSKPRHPGVVPSSPGSNLPSSLERVHLSYCVNLSLAGITSLLSNCPRLSHLSLTGVEEFLREDLLLFCRDVPREFTDQQRNVFCVFSGNNVSRLREFLLQQQQQMSHEHLDPDIQATRFGTVLDTRNSLDADHPARVALPASPSMPPVQLALSSAAHPNREFHQSLPARFPSTTTVFGMLSLTGQRRTHLPRLHIPSPPVRGLNGTPSQSPTNDAPLSVDEGEEFLETSDMEAQPQAIAVTN